MGTGDMCRMPIAAVRHGSAWKSSERGPCGDCRRVLLRTGPTGSVFGESSFYCETCNSRRGARHVAKCNSYPRVAYPEVKVQVRDLCPKGGLYRGKICFTEPKVVKGHRRLVLGAPPTSGMPRESQAKFRDGTMWGL